MTSSKITALNARAAPSGTGVIAGMTETRFSDLLDSPLEVINVGLEGFAEELLADGGEVVHVDWSPPAGGDVEMAKLLSKLGA
jgi:hypothetical protein